MAKVKSKTDELLKKLGASLKESPLSAHERGTRAAEVPEPPQAKTLPAVERVERKETRAEENNPSNNPLRKAVGAMMSAAGIENKNTPKRPEKELTGADRMSRVAIAAAQVAVRPSVATMANEKQPEEAGMSAAPGVGQKTPERAVMPGGLSPIEWAEAATEVQLRSGAPLTAAQVSALQQAPAAERAGVALAGDVPELTSLAETLKKLGAPMEEKQLVQWRELQAMREAIAELKALQKKTATAPMTAPMPQAWTNYAGGSERVTQSGWRTSTVGMYPEDYDKAYAVMNYLRAQTGQAVNLSRVIKIALRALEVGPNLVELNAQIRQKDGRVVRR